MGAEALGDAVKVFWHFIVVLCKLRHVWLRLMKDFLVLALIAKQSGTKARKGEHMLPRKVKLSNSFTLPYMDKKYLKYIPGQNFFF